MLFNKEFKVVKVYGDTGIRSTGYVKLNEKGKNEIEELKKSAESYEMFGKEGIIVWLS